jgi:cysteine-rich repeat protein
MTTCGDGIIAGPETCDDGDKFDNKGWNDQCTGVIRGWYWSVNPSAPPAFVCNTQLMDGIHVSPEEDWDDGNYVDVGDGCTNSGTIEYKWDWVDDLLNRSIWVPKWGNGKVDHVDEEWDDNNYDSNDGCTNCLIDSGWQCFNGSATTKDNWFKQPKAYIDYLSETNEVTIKFTRPMKNLTLSNSPIMNLTITGPLSPYKFTYSAGFEDKNTLMINITMASAMRGDDQEKYTIDFDTSEFLSINEANLITTSLFGYLYKIPMLPDILNPIGTGVGTSLSITLIFLVASNIILGQSSELLWGFMNTMQIMLFFPVLQLYYPDVLAEFFTFFSAAKLKVDLPGMEGVKSKLRKNYSIKDKMSMPSLNYRYESIDYESTSILLNGENIFQILIQGFIACACIFAYKAILFTIQANTEIYEKELKEFQLREIEATSANLEKESIVGLQKNNYVSEKTLVEKESRTRIWVKKKIMELSQEYKYNFFLRIGLELFLEIFVLSLLNIRHSKLNNIYQITSFGISWIFIALWVSFFIWSIIFSWRNYFEIKGKKFEKAEFYSMFGEYKMDNMPQMLFNTFFMTRRILYAWIIIFLPDFPIYQAFSFMAIGVPILAYHLAMNPYRDVSNNVFMNINEALLVFVGAFFFVFAEPHPSEKDQKVMTILSWWVIWMIILVMLINIVALWVMKITMIIRQIKDWIHHFKTRPKPLKNRKQKANNIRM